MNEATQLTLSINDDKSNPPTFQNGLNINNGQKVKYLGNISGGPLTGSKGVIKKLYANKAVVDMGLVGTWNVPYYFLSETA